MNSNASLPSDFLWIKCGDLNDEIKRGDTNISLATLMLRADEEGKTELIISVTKIDDDDDGNPINASTTSGLLEVEMSKIYFDTGTPANPYPSISGTHKGAITPSQTITVSKLYTYPCPGTGGHTEYVRIYGHGVDESASWKGYSRDWHNITFDSSFTLESSKRYNYTIRTGSYPQIIHERVLDAIGGKITCSEFIDVNGRSYHDWIPAIRLEEFCIVIPFATEEITHKF